MEELDEEKNLTRNLKKQLNKYCEVMQNKEIELALLSNQKKMMSKEKEVEKKTHPLFQSKPRNFRVGNSIQPTRNLTRFVRWPKYIAFQRQKRILLTRIKVPSIIAQFSRALDRNQGSTYITQPMFCLNYLKNTLLKTLNSAMLDWLLRPS